MISPDVIAALNAKFYTKLEAVKKRTENDSLDTLRMRLASAEFNLDNTLDQREFFASMLAKVSGTSNEQHPVPPAHAGGNKE